ncbi:9582_t:CDS:1, partial [Funneliformis mosseae]
GRVSEKKNNIIRKEIGVYSDTANQEYSDTAGQEYLNTAGQEDYPNTSWQENRLDTVGQ